MTDTLTQSYDNIQFDNIQAVKKEKPIYTSICACGCGKTISSKVPNIKYFRGHKPKDISATQIGLPIKVKPQKTPLTTEEKNTPVNITPRAVRNRAGQFVPGYRSLGNNNGEGVVKLPKGECNVPEGINSKEFQLNGVKSGMLSDNTRHRDGKALSVSRANRLYDLIDKECGPFAERVIERFVQVALLTPDDPDFKKYGANNIMSAALEVIKYRFGRPSYHVEHSGDVNVNKRIMDVTKLVNSYYDNKPVEPKQLDLAQKVIKAEVMEEKGDKNFND